MQMAIDNPLEPNNTEYTEDYTALNAKLFDHPAPAEETSNMTANQSMSAQMDVSTTFFVDMLGKNNAWAKLQTLLETGGTPE